MPILTCRNCGRQTNTAVSDHLRSRDGKADRCFVAWENGKPVRGCAYAEGSWIDKHLADVVLGKQTSMR